MNPEMSRYLSAEVTNAQPEIAEPAGYEEAMAELQNTNPDLAGKIKALSAADRQSLDINVVNGHNLMWGDFAHADEREVTDSFDAWLNALHSDNQDKARAAKNLAEVISKNI
jgi:hypothetical protein